MRSTFTNTFKTFILLAFLGAVFIGIGAIFGTGGLIIGAVLGLLFVGGTFWFSDKIAVAAARAKPVSRDEAPRLYEIVGDLARRDDMPMPRLYVSPGAAAQRLRDRPRTEEGRRRRHAGHPRGARRRRAAGRARPRDVARQATATSSSDRWRPPSL